MAANNRQKPENRISLQFISVLIAIALWLIISYTEDPVIDVTLSNISIEYRGIENLAERGLTIPNSLKNQSLTVSASGKRTDLVQVIRKMKAYVDVSDIAEADTYTLDVNIELPIDTVLITKQKNKTLNVAVERVVSKEVPVVIKQTDKNKDYFVKSVSQQKTVNLTGPENMLTDVSCVMVAVNTIDMKADNVQEYNYRIMDSNNSEVDNKENFTADVPTICVQNELYTPTPLDIELIVPEEVSSLYDVELIQSPTLTVGTREGAPETLSVKLPDNTITGPGITEFTSIVNNEQNIYIEDDNKTVKLRVQVTKKELQYVQLPIRFKNVDPQYAASSDVASIDTYINCVPSKLSEASLVAYADMSGYGEGIHEILLTYEDTNDIKVIGDYRVYVTLTKKN